MPHVPWRRGRATVVESDGGRVRFDFAEVRAQVRDKIAALVPPDKRDDVAIDAAVNDVVNYVVTVCSSVRLTTKYKPWKHQENPNPESNSAYRKGYYDGWAGHQDMLRFELIHEQG